MSEEDEMEYIGFKAPTTLVKAMDKYIARDTHTSRSEFLRTAVREKVSRKNGGIIGEIMEEKRKAEEGG